MKLPLTIAIEEHYWDDELASHFVGSEGSRAGPIEKRLRDFGGERISDMDRAGIDLCILSHGAPSAQKISADIAVPLIEGVNNRLAVAVASNPTRLAAFAALPTVLPAAAADELSRCVAMGFKGAMLHGMSNGEFLDHRKFWPIYERAEQLDVPIYLHPALPHPAVMDAYYKDYLTDYPMLARPAWGYAVETGTQVVRLILSGVFEKYPNLKVVLGHLGESVPFQLWRLDQALSRPGQKSVKFREIFTNNFWVTTSGFFSTPALMCCAMELGVDRIMFAVDWPFVSDSQAGVEWMKTVPLCAEDKAKILSGNAERLFRL
ncbi:MAG: amidohydrolase [Polaromonas sp.]|uniref:amidohydrolase family protein n=1 Tax=Polaromonas sp. TaxID=1869339 RepID=UPI0025EB7B50|nr:amidohydrolase family protein [Polaromonas sp.]MBI2726537.1 amidohydrolase [Polaromonas sp.]